MSFYIDYFHREKMFFKAGIAPRFHNAIDTIKHEFLDVIM